MDFKDFDLASFTPDFEEIERKRQETLEWTRTTLHRGDAFVDRIARGDPITFNTLSLPAWLKIAELAAIDFIPAREIHSMPTQIIQDFDPGEGSGPYEIEEQKILSALRKGEMLRMEQVAPAEIKHERSSGQIMGNGTFYSDHFERDILNLFEDRYYTTLLDLAEDQVRAYARPIITPRMINGKFNDEAGKWPEEFRVYIRDGHIKGVSNYYPQVVMTPQEHGNVMAEAVRAAQDMVNFMIEKKITCDNATYRMPEGETFSCTLDFLIREDGKLLFLEGGPEGGRGAHPCCFLGPDGFKSDLEGAVFSEDGEVYPLEHLLAGRLEETPAPT
ncbi:hypothetical protein [Pseudosulfitobacter pseudonitzschiae]|uniref:hypothetical protein n=1 Tax=Pseudosulfitobacter pseudonitzschiae TaxID=1402135 RepID=UPI003B776C71